MAYRDPEKGREARRRRYHENLEKERAACRQYYAENSKSEREKKRLYYKENSDKVAEQQARYRAENTDKITEQNARYYAENSDKLCELATLWAKKNPIKKREIIQRRRARKRGATIKPISPGLRARKLNEQGWLCYWCETDLRALPSKMIHMDHVVPLSRGGEESEENYVASCAPCNQSKGTKTGEAFMAWLLKLKKRR